MTVLPALEWKLDGFRKSSRQGKKITAMLSSKDGLRKREVHFGQRGSETYQNKTGVDVDQVHGDKKKRELYRKRHAGEGDPNKKYSAGWLSWWYLW